jgi:hypothetical protein
LELYRDSLDHSDGDGVTTRAWRFGGSRFNASLALPQRPRTLHKVTKSRLIVRHCSVRYVGLRVVGFELVVVQGLPDWCARDAPFNSLIEFNVTSDLNTSRAGVAVTGHVRITEPEDHTATGGQSSILFAREPQVVVAIM